MGGGTSDVWLLTIEDGIFEEKATAGDTGEHETAVCGKFNLKIFSEDSKRTRSNTTITVFMGASLLDACRARPSTQTTVPNKWQIQTAQQPHGKIAGSDYTTEFEKENDDMLEENFMTVYVKTIYGKTISIKCGTAVPHLSISSNSQMQLEPAKYTSFISVVKNTVSAEGSRA